MSTLELNRLDYATASEMFEEYLANPGQIQDPSPMFHALREVDPVHRTASGLWVVLGHPEAQQAYLNTSLGNAAALKTLVRRFGDVTPSAKFALEVYSSHPNVSDNPEHARLRPLMQHAFSPKAIRQWDATIVDGVHELVENIKSLDSFDLLRDYSARLPAMVIADILGIPREDTSQFVGWTDEWFNNINFTDQSSQYPVSAVRPIEQFVEYIRALIQARREDPAGKSDGLVGFLMDAEEDGDRLNERELIAAIMLIIIGGYETTANTISNACYCLMQHPVQLRKLINDPSLVSSAVEEALRFQSPARGQLRTAMEDVEIAGKTIREGETLQIYPLAANRDGRVFDQPDEFDITRSPNRHVAFGYGIHSCIGVHIARLEARHAISAIAEDLPNLEIDGDIAWRNAHVRGLTAFPVKRR